MDKIFKEVAVDNTANSSVASATNVATADKCAVEVNNKTENIFSVFARVMRDCERFYGNVSTQVSGGYCSSEDFNDVIIDIYTTPTKNLHNAEEGKTYHIATFRFYDNGDQVFPFIHGKATGINEVKEYMPMVDGYYPYSIDNSFFWRYYHDNFARNGIKYSDFAVYDKSYREGMKKWEKVFKTENPIFKYMKEEDKAIHKERKSEKRLSKNEELPF